MLNLTLLNALVLEGVQQAIVLSPTLKTQKDLKISGKIGQSIDVYIDVLKDVSVKKYTAAQKALQADYEFDVINLGSVPVVLVDETYAALEVDGWDNLVINAQNVNDYTGVIKALVRKIVEDLEGSVAVTMLGITNHAITIAVGTAAEQGEALVSEIQDMSFTLDDKGVPAEDRYLAVGRNVAKRLLANKDILNADKSGSVDALRSAIIGEVAGFIVVKSSRIGDNVSVAYHTEAFGLISRAPGKNVSATYSESVSADEAVIDLRVNVLGLGKRNATGITASTFFTVADLDSANRAIKNTYNFATV